VILVTGATGKVGRHLVAGLLAEGAPVRALTRNPEAADLPDGAEVARIDPGQPETIAAALAGTAAVFVNATAVGGLLTDLMAEAARAGTRTAVMLSSLTVRDNGVQPYSIGAHHKALEEVVMASGLDRTFLRCGGFAANTLAWAPMIRGEGVVRAPYLNAATAPIAEEGIAALTARRCTPRSGSGRGAPRTRRRARLASCRVALSVRPMIWPTSSNRMSNTSCSTKARRSAGLRLSSTTSRARPTESAISACCSGPSAAGSSTRGSGSQAPT